MLLRRHGDNAAALTQGVPARNSVFLRSQMKQNRLAFSMYQLKPGVVLAWRRRAPYLEGGGKNGHRQ